MHPSSDRSRLVRVGRIALALFISILSLIFLVDQVRVAVRVPTAGGDFRAYYSAAWAARKGVFPEVYAAIPRAEEGIRNPHLNEGFREGSALEAIYRERIPGPYRLPYIYPPPLAVSLVPLTALDFSSAYRAFVVLNVLLLLLGFWAASRVAGRWGRLASLTAALAGTLVFGVPVFNMIAEGQVAGLLTASWGLSAYLAWRRRPGWSGALLGLGAAIKLTPAIAVPFMLARKEWRWCGGFMTGLLAPLVISAMVVGGQTTVAGLTEIPGAQSCGLVRPLNASLTSTTAQLIAEVRGTSLPQPEGADAIFLQADEASCRVAQAGIGGLLLLVLLGLFLTPSHRLPSIPVQLLAVVPLSLTLSPVTWMHAYLQIALPLLLLAALLGPEGWKTTLFWVLTVVLTVAWPWRVYAVDGLGPGVAVIAALAIATTIPVALFAKLQYPWLERSPPSEEPDHA